MCVVVLVGEWQGRSIQKKVHRVIFNVISFIVILNCVWLAKMWWERDTGWACPEQLWKDILQPSTAEVGLSLLSPQENFWDLQI